MQPAQFVGKRWYEIDLLRFLAALSVVLFHYGFRGYAADHMTIMPTPGIVPFVKYGYLGVNLFFIISGFVILMSASSGSARKFFISRIARLYPAFWVCCTLTFVIIAVFGGSQYTASLHQYAVNMTMLSGFLKVPPMDGVYWSLFVEMKFYGLILLVLLLRQLHRIEIFLGLWLCAALLLDNWPHPYISYFLIPEFAPLFIAGATFYRVCQQGWSSYRVVLVAVSFFLAVGSEVMNTIAYQRQFQVPFSSEMVVLLMASFFAAFWALASGRTGFFARPVWLVIGALTYPLYLLHQNIGYILFNRLYPAVEAPTLLVGTILLMLGCAYLINRQVEQRCSTWLKRGLRRLLQMG